MYMSIDDSDAPITESLNPLSLINQAIKRHLRYTRIVKQTNNKTLIN